MCVCECLCESMCECVCECVRGCYCVCECVRGCCCVCECVRGVLLLGKPSLRMFSASRHTEGTEACMLQKASPVAFLFLTIKSCLTGASD